MAASRGARVTKAPYDMLWVKVLCTWVVGRVGVTWWQVVIELLYCFNFLAVPLPISSHSIRVSAQKL